MNQSISNAKSPRAIDIYSRIDNFVLEVIKFTRIVPKILENIEILKQLVRSVCSIGANANEADGTLTHKEFLHVFSIARREAKETKYWLILLSKLNPSLESKLSPIINEAQELVLILSKIISNSRKNDL